MATRFVVFTDVDSADYVINGFGFKYTDFPPEVVATIMQTATKYKVVKREVEHYSHEEMGDYTYVTEVATYELDKVKSVSEKIWLKNEGAGDIIVVDGKFFGVVFFTGFTDYRGKEEFGFIPLEHLQGGQKALSNYCLNNLSILVAEGTDIFNTPIHIAAQETGRTTRSWDKNFHLEKK